LILGVTKPYLGGIIDRYAWISEATGMMGYVERLRIGDLPGTKAPTQGDLTGAVRTAAIVLLTESARDLYYVPDNNDPHVVLARRPINRLCHASP
jgi:hypothetical protein